MPTLPAMPSEPQSVDFITEMMVKLTKRGLILQVETDGRITILNEKAQRRREAKRRRDQQRYAKRKSENGRKRAETGGMWQGITWREMPGKDKQMKLMNLCLLRRRDYRGYESCYDLQGAALKAEIQRCSAPQRAKAMLSGPSRRAAAEEAKNL